MGAVADEFGVDAPAQAGSDEQAQAFKAAFAGHMGALGGSLQFTAAHAETAKHEPLAGRRDALYPAFQAANGQIDPANPSKAQGAIDRVLGDAQTLAGEASALQEAVQQALEAWEARAGDFEQAVRQIEELEAWQDPQAAALRGQADQARAQADERRYEEALATLDALAPAIEPVHEEYLRQKEAQPEYEAQLAEQGSRLEPLKAAERPSQPMTSKAGEAESALEQARAKADAKDYVAGLEQMEAVAAAVDELDELCNDSERAQFLADIGTLDTIVQPPDGEPFQSQQAEWGEITASTASIGSTGDCGDYAGANAAIAELKDRVEAFKAKHEELQQHRTAYEEAKASLQPRIDAAASSEPQYATLQPQVQQITSAQAAMDASAQAEDFEQAEVQAGEIGSQLDELEEAKAEIDEQKQAYEAALAGLQPRLDAASVSDAKYARLQTQATGIDAARIAMQSSADGGQYATALEQAEALDCELEALEEAKAEIDAKEAEFEEAYAALRPRLDATQAKAPSEALETMRGNLLAEREAIEASATAGDYEAALAAVESVETNLQAYEEALEAHGEQKAEYDALLATLQPRLEKAATDESEKRAGQREALASGRQKMEAAALIGNYEEALNVAEELGTQLDAFEEAVEKEEAAARALTGDISIDMAVAEFKGAYTVATAKVGAGVAFNLQRGADPKEATKEEVEQGLREQIESVILKSKWDVGLTPKANPKDKSLTLAMTATWTCDWGQSSGSWTPLEVSLVGYEKGKGFTGPKISPLAIALNYKRQETIAGVAIEFTLGGSFTVEVAPDWNKLVAEGLAVDMEALTAAAAAVMLPLAAGAAILAGAVQAARNTDARLNAINQAIPARKKAAKLASDYARALSGGGSGSEGGQHAEAQIEQVMEKTGASREEALAAIQKEQGDYGTIRARELRKIKDRMYAEACAAFDDARKGEFGPYENTGPEGGFRGEFRSQYRMILYADD